MRSRYLKGGVTWLATQYAVREVIKRFFFKLTILGFKPSCHIPFCGMHFQHSNAFLKSSSVSTSKMHRNAENVNGNSTLGEAIESLQKFVNDVTQFYQLIRNFLMQIKIQNSFVTCDQKRTGSHIMNLHMKCHQQFWGVVEWVLTRRHVFLSHALNRRQKNRILWGLRVIFIIKLIE